MIFHQVKLHNSPVVLRLFVLFFSCTGTELKLNSHILIVTPSCAKPLQLGKVAIIFSLVLLFQHRKNISASTQLVSEPPKTCPQLFEIVLPEYKRFYQQETRLANTLWFTFDSSTKIIMASPPYNHSYSSAISPPYPSNAQLPAPLKRRQTDMPSAAPSIKRRKASMLSTTSATSSAHPLRQTSFPPENNARTPAFSRSPSMDTMSLVSGSGTKKKRPRKSKGKDAETSSMAGGRAKSAVSNEGRGKRRGSRDQTAEEEEEEEGGEEMALDVVAASNEEKAREDRRKHILTNAFSMGSGQQFARYEAWRSSKLSDATVRRVSCYLLALCEHT